MLLNPAQVSADWSWDVAWKGAKKITKKVVLPASVIFHGVAAAEIIGNGLGGAASKIGESIKETVEDVKTISSAAVELYNE